MSGRFLHLLSLVSMLVFSDHFTTRHNKTLIIFLILLFYGCKQENNIPYYQISKETKAWVYYETGSFWIYQDTILYQIDSIAVDSSLLEKKYHGQISSHDVTYYYDSLKYFIVRIIIPLKLII